MGTVGSNPTPSALNRAIDSRKGSATFPSTTEFGFRTSGGTSRCLSFTPPRSIALFLLLGLTLGLTQVDIAVAQVVPLYDIIYRPPEVSYVVHRGKRFDIIYEPSLRDQAIELYSVLLSSLAGTDSLTGSRSRLRMPVVLSGYNDRANGFMTSFPFKQEIIATGLKGRGLSRRHPTWTSVVAPHELVHGAQAEYSDGPGVVGFVHWFSPDFARSLNMFGPPGVAEGLAVLRESRLTPGAGRLNHPFFQMQFRASFEDGKGWSLARMLESPEYTRPFDRFYEGGAYLMQYIEETLGTGAIQRLLKWQYRFPFLGFGWNLRYATGRSSRTFGREMRHWYLKRERDRLAELGKIERGELIYSRVGTLHRRPLWLNDSTIIAFSLGYNLRRGFYTFDRVTGSRNKLFETRITEDATFSLAQDSGDVLYSRYDRDRRAEVQERAILLEYDLRGQSGVKSIPSPTGLLNPVRTSEGTTFALQNDGQYNNLVEVRSDGTLVRLLDYRAADFVSIMPRPGTDSLAVILKTGTHQALFVSSTTPPTKESLHPWIGFKDATVYDAAWSRDGHYLVFTSDVSGVLNVYVADAEEERIWQITNVPYAAMEGAMSPSNSEVVFVEYRDQRFDLRRISFKRETAGEISRDDANYTWLLPWDRWLDEGYYAVSSVSATSSTVVATPPATDGPSESDRAYRAINYLKPRMLYPTFYLDQPRKTGSDARLGFGVGLAVQGTDPLERWAYYGEGIVRKQQVWGEAGIQWGGSRLRPSLKFFRRGQTLNGRISDTSGVREQRVIRDRRGISLGIDVPITIAENVRRTSLTSFVDIAFRQDQFFDDDLNPLSKRTDRLTVLPGMVYGYRLQHNPRDIVPNTGIVLRWFGDFDIADSRKDFQKGIMGLLDVYLPFLSSSNTGIHLNFGVVNQNIANIFNLRFFKPRGLEDVFVSDGTFLRYSLTITQPLLFVDNGTTIIPFFFKALYLYGFGDYMHEAAARRNDYSSVGAGLGFQFRLWYVFDLNLKFGAAYLPQSRTWEAIYR